MVIYKNKSISKDELIAILGRNQRVSGFHTSSPYIDSFFSSEKEFELKLRVNNRYNLFMLNGKAIGV